MKKQIKETLVMGKRGPQRVITHGYDTQIIGLDIIRTINRNGKEFTPVHRKSGLSLAVYFPTATKAMKFANKHFTGFDFMQNKDDLLMDGKLSGCVKNAIEIEGL